MPYCRKCGQEISDTDRICLKCGFLVGSTNADVATSAEHKTGRNKALIAATIGLSITLVIAVFITAVIYSGILTRNDMIRPAKVSLVGTIGVITKQDAGKIITLSEQVSSYKSVVDTVDEPEDAIIETEPEIYYDDLISVGIINNDPNESGYRTANDNDMKATFTEENGYDASFFYSLKNDEQIAAAWQFVYDDVDYLLICAAGTSGWDSVLTDAQTAGIKVILFDRLIDADESLYDAYVVADMYQEGLNSVAWLESQGLDEYKIIHIQGVMGSSAQIGRSQALDEMVEANDNWTLVTQQTAEWNAETAEQIVQAVIDSGEDFNVIYAENDDMAKGAVAALDKANISHGVDGDVIIMGYDCNQWALEEVLAGNWNFDQQCSPFYASYIDELIKNYEQGIVPTEKCILIDEMGFDAATITQDDVDTYGI